ncbi:MAG: dioxygenase [Sedimenticola sp.]|nr:dioxygenase [Sedimenticola sp.]
MPSLPTLFVSHGAPDFILHDHPAIQALQQIGQQYASPATIVIVSAHWIRDPIGVTSGASHTTIHDFYGFDEALYRLEYPARGNPELATALVTQLAEAGLKAQCIPDRGLDHGAWVPLMLAYPEADIPVIQVSLPSDDLQQCARLGKALASFREQDILVIGSGGSVHNLRAMNREQHTGEWARDFEAWLKQAVESGDGSALENPHQATALFPRTHPSVEHYSPLLVARAAAGNGAMGLRIHSSFTYGNIGMAMYEFD